MRVQSIDYLVGHRLPVGWTRAILNLVLVLGVCVAGYLAGLPAWACLGVAAWELGAILDTLFRVLGGRLAGGDYGPGRAFLTRYLVEALVVGVAAGLSWLPGRPLRGAIPILLALVPMVALGALFWVAIVAAVGVSDPPALTLGDERALDVGEQELSRAVLENYLAHAAASALFHVLGRKRAARMLRFLGTPWFWRAHLGAWHDQTGHRNIPGGFLLAARLAGIESPAERLYRFLTAAAERTGACDKQAIRRLAGIGEELGLDEATVWRVLRSLQMARWLSRQEAAAMLGVPPEASADAVEAAYQRQVADQQPGSEASERFLAARCRLLADGPGEGR